jgi:hypothetical protein
MTRSASPARKMGRPSKGERVGTHVALPADFRTEIEDMAAREGLPMGAIITRLVAIGLGKPTPDYCLPRLDEQEELPLTKAS